MAPRAVRCWLIWGTLTFAFGLFGTAVKADPIYTVTNLGSGNITFATAGGGSVNMPAGGLPSADLATSQLVSVSSGQVAYSFATSPDTVLQQGQGALSNIPASLLNPEPGYSPTFLTGLSNANGYAVVVQTSSLSTDPSMVFSSAGGYTLSSSGTVEWGHGVTITYPPGGSTDDTGSVTVTGINSANQALIGTGFQGSPALVYNLATNTLTNLATLPPFSTTQYFNPLPMAIDNQGQILVLAGTNGSTGTVLDTLLLTPSGEPVVTTPEPGTWIIWSLIAGASCVAARRRIGTRGT